MKRSGKTNPDFWDIKKYLPAETQSYVMNFITLNVLFHNYELFTKDELNFKPEKIVIPATLDEVVTETGEEFIGPAPK